MVLNEVYSPSRIYNETKDWTINFSYSLFKINPKPNSELLPLSGSKLAKIFNLTDMKKEEHLMRV